MNVAQVITLLETVERICNTQTDSEVLDLFGAALTSYGFTASLVAGLPEVDPAEWPHHIVANRWPQEWFDYYIKHRLYDVDPCAARARQGLEPFFWNELLSDELGEEERRVMDLAADFGLKQGICVPIIRPFSSPAVVTVSGEAIDLPSDTLGVVQMMAINMFAQLVALGQGDDAVYRRHLTPREREVLKWVAAGKTVWEVSCILSLSYHTVGTHLRNAREKLDAVNITHCVVEALRRQEIEL